MGAVNGARPCSFITTPPALVSSVACSNWSMARSESLSHVLHRGSSIVYVQAVADGEWTIAAPWISCPVLVVDALRALRVHSRRDALLALPRCF